MIPVSAVSPIAASRPIERLGDAARPPTQPAEAAALVASETRLSPTAALLEALQTATNLPESAVGAPLLAAPPAPIGPGTLVLAQALQQGLAESGLFYESHLGEWVQGDRTVASLLREPQGQLPVLNGANQAPAASRDHPSAVTLLSERAAAHDLMQGAPIETERSPVTHTLTADQLAQIVDPRALALVQQQLQAIDTQVIPWHGEVWPGQQAHWTVSTPVDPEGCRTQGDPERSWTSHLKVTLPHLGEVHAEITLSGARCQVGLRSDQRQLSGLRTALPDLARALGDAGLRAERIIVERHDE